MTQSPIAIVFGATGNVGAPVAKALHSDGYEVLLIGTNAEKLQQLKTSFGSADATSNVHIISGIDVASFQSTQDAAAKVKSLLGERKFSALVFNATIPAYTNPEDPLSTIDEATVQKLFTVKIGGATNVLKSFIPLAALGANVLLTGGGSGTKMIIPAIALAGSSNAALLALVKGISAALHKKHDGLQVTAVQLSALVNKEGPMGISNEALGAAYLKLAKRTAQEYKDEEYIMAPPKA